MPISKNKGNKGEREVVALLKKYWQSDEFMRSPESGAMSTVFESIGAPGDITARLAGDVLCPPDFPFCVESKLYASIDLWACIRNPDNCDITQWWRQCKTDAKRGRRIPLLTFREDKKQRYVAMCTADMETLIMERPTIGHLDILIDDKTIRIFSWADFEIYFAKDRLGMPYGEVLTAYENPTKSKEKR